MRLYLDDALAAPALAGLLRKVGHDVQLPIDAGMAGQDDSIHLTHAIRENRICLTRDHVDFENLHNLLMVAGGHHPGLLFELFDDNPKHNLTPRDIVRALHNLEAAGVPFPDSCYVLNQWK